MVRQTAAWAQGLLHRLFTATLAVKGSLASIEAAVGAWLWVRAQFPAAPDLPVERSIEWLTQHDLTQDADDPVVRTLAEQAQHLPLMPADNFYYFYLVMHGLLKLVMVSLLARKVRWAYPAAMTLLAAFVVYQGIEFTRTHSVYLLMLCGFDTFMIWLVGREYGLLRRAV